MTTPDRDYFERLQPQLVDVVYRNYRGEVRRRHVQPTGEVWYGKSGWHDQPQYFIKVRDLETRASGLTVLRDFALNDVLAWGSEACDAWQATQDSLVAAAGG